jgi:hypothetical protein
MALGRQEAVAANCPLHTRAPDDRHMSETREQQPTEQ